MEHLENLEREINSLLNKLPNREQFQHQLDNFRPGYPFNKYEFMISTLLAMDILNLEEYYELRDSYFNKNPYLYIFEFSGPKNFGNWAEEHLKGLVPDLQKPSKETDKDYSGQYDFYLDGNIRIEVKASRAVDANSKEPLLCVKALSSDSTKDFRMNFQQQKPGCCDVFVWVGVWLDVIRYWILSSYETETSPRYSKGQHRGNAGEGQLHVKQDNIQYFEHYTIKPNKLEEAIRLAADRQVEYKTKIDSEDTSK